jgi:hypothetical protein
MLMQPASSEIGLITNPGDAKDNLKKIILHPFYNYTPNGQDL